VSKKVEQVGSSSEQIQINYCPLNATLVDRQDHSKESDQGLAPKQNFFWGVGEGGFDCVGVGEGAQRRCRRRSQ